MTTETVLLTKEKTIPIEPKWTGDCTMLKTLRKLKVPHCHWEEIMFVCYAHGGCLPCVLHKEGKK